MALLQSITRSKHDEIPSKCLTARPQDTRPLGAWTSQIHGFKLVQNHSRYADLQRVPHLCGFHYRGYHYRNFWLMYTQVGDFRISRGPPTVPLTQILHNTVFFKSQNPNKARTLCMLIFANFKEAYIDFARIFLGFYQLHNTWFLRYTFFQEPKTAWPWGLAAPLYGCLPLANQTDSSFISSENLGI